MDGTWWGNNRKIKLNGALPSFEYGIWLRKIFAFFETFPTMMTVSLSMRMIEITPVDSCGTRLVECNCLELRIDMKGT